MSDHECVTEAAISTETRTKRDDSLRCRACSHVLAQQRAALSMQGSHEHTFRNPAGYSFHLLCFSESPGCASVGPLTSEACWFKGYSWCFAICAECQTHVGWHYAGQAPPFTGLIATRVLRPL